MEKAKLTNDKFIEEFVSASMNFIENRISSNFQELTPEVSRKIELLEVLAISLIEHADNPTLLSNLETHMDAMTSLNGQRLQ